MTRYYLHNGDVVTNDVSCPGEGGWCDAQLVAVVPIGDRAQVERLRDLTVQALREQIGYNPTDNDAGFTETDLANALQAALREFADPPPPDEPQALGAVVQDADGVPWVRCENADREPHWYARNKKRDYADISVTRVLSEGWTEGGER